MSFTELKTRYSRIRDDLQARIPAVPEPGRLLCGEERKRVAAAVNGALGS